MAAVMRVVEMAVAILALAYLVGNLLALVVRWRASRHRLYGVVLVGCLVSTALDAQAAGRVFFDDSEAGNTNLWNQDGSHPRCTSVTTAADGVQGPYAGSRMIRCNDDGVAHTYESLASPTFSMTNEVLYRYRLRPDSNHASTSGSTHKIGRIFYFTGDSGTYVDVFSMFATVGSGNGMYNDMIIDGNRQGGSLYWGDAGGDDTANPANWHTIMYYLNKSTGVSKVWHDGILVRNHTAGAISGEVGENGDFYITSNWEDAHDATNYVYFDDVEIFTDAGTGGTGTMSDGTMTQSGGGGGESGTLALFLAEWAPLALGILWHTRKALLASVLAASSWTGVTAILAADEVKAISAQAATTTMQAATSVLAKVRR